ncbi:hypothetical protein BCR37DRAFT_394804 [Protomyces lactucae-debilis]|uniref:Uncharacterized protein n=1 Tax=Protomyces lactucae-debilis TaxID=2754530 RepID=A0A1Y2F1E4_PROLT|nr:uncharacterized protein BCR37DRAFT_394804 [Protomyces lactucae-debilis]ORY77712.1 hypothetical protein BCR37DRAFT_394804 [Protomyces lactucae-debilis]
MNALSEIAVNHGLAREDSPSSRRQKLFDTEGGTAKGPGGAPQNMDSRLQSKAIPTFPFYQLASPSAFSISSIASVQPVQEDFLPFTSTTTTTSTSAFTHFPVTPYNSNFLGDSMLSFYSLASGNESAPFQSAITLVEEPTRRRSWAESFLSLFHMNEKLPVEPEAIVNPYNGFWRSTSTIAIVNASEEAEDEDDDDDDLSVYNDDFLLYSDVDDYTTMTSISALPAPALALRTRPWVDSYLSLLQPCELSANSEYSTTHTAIAQQPSGPEFRYPVPVWLGQYIAVARIAKPDVAIDELIELYEASKFMLDANGDPLKMLPAEALPEPSSKKRAWKRALKKAASKVCAKFKQTTMEANRCAADRVSVTNGPLEQEQEQEEEAEQKAAKLRRRTNLARKVVSLFKSRTIRSTKA